MNISSTRFESNVGVEKGGYIYYDYKRPYLHTDLVVNNNSAKYGPDIASYAVKLTIASDPNAPLELNDLGSGIVYSKNLSLSLRDFDNQIMNLDSQNQIILLSKNISEAQVGGFNSGKLSKTNCFSSTERRNSLF